MTKNIAILFDGTAFRSFGDRLSNVARLGMAVERRSADGAPQIVLYQRGVGSGFGTFKRHKRMDRTLGGMFAYGLDDILINAYRQLVFVFEPGDRIYLLGWSRGAFAAWRFADILQHFGVLAPEFIPEIPDIVALELSEDKLSSTTGRFVDLQGVRAEKAVAHADTGLAALNRLKTGAPKKPELWVNYLGMWDCVAAIGMPLGLNKRFGINRHVEGASALMPRLVASARHAVALDEGSIFFPPRLIEGTIDMERVDQKFFPGGHAAVGGAVEDNVIGHLALRWVALGADAAGLKLDFMRLGGFDRTAASLEDVHLRSGGIFGWDALNRKREFLPQWSHLHPMARDLAAREPSYADKWCITVPEP